MCIINRFMAEVQGNELVSRGVIWGRPLQIIERNMRSNHVVVKREGYTAGGGRGSINLQENSVHVGTSRYRAHFGQRKPYRQSLG